MAVCGRRQFAKTHAFIANHFCFQKTSQLINKGCQLIPVDKSNNFLLSKFFRLVERILVEQKVVLDEQTLSNLLQHIIGSARWCPGISVYDILKLLCELLYENGVKCQKVLVNVI